MTDGREVLLVLFDLPVQTAVQCKEYRCFRRALKDEGFVPLQESVYALLLHNSSAVSSAMLQLEQAAPEEGAVAVLPLSLRSFQSMIPLRGKLFDFSRFSDNLNPLNSYSLICQKCSSYAALRRLFPLKFSHPSGTDYSRKIV